MSVRTPFRVPIRCFLSWFLVWISAVIPIPAGYKARPYVPLPIESYPSRLTSEGLTVAVEPMFTDALAAKAFDKKDIVTSGIMPLAIIISNKNGFAVEVRGSSIELIVKRDRILPVGPEEAVMRIFQHTLPPQEVRIPSPVPFPRVAIYRSNADAFDDFSRKHLGIKRTEPNSVAAGFVYLPVKTVANLREDLAGAQIYIPDLYRVDTGQPMMFLEIDLEPAVNAGPKK